MVPVSVIDGKFWQRLFAIDIEISARVAAQGCQYCGGPLHRGDYPRKSRGGLLSVEDPSLCLRVSLCCGRRGCRRRATPPSVRFLGRRVYVEATVITACIAAATISKAAAIVEATDAPARTVRRWRSWWHSDFVATRFFREQQGRFIPPVDQPRLPASLLDRFAAAATTVVDALVKLCAFLAPLTTMSVENGARFVRVA